LLLALTPVADAFEALGVAYYVGGSFASSARGIARASLDVDLVAALRPEHETSLGEAGSRRSRVRSQFSVIDDRTGVGHGCPPR
jgi:hypothetical protein